MERWNLGSTRIRCMALVWGSDPNKVWFGASKTQTPSFSSERYRENKNTHLMAFLFQKFQEGRNADESDAEAIIDMAGKASLADQQKQVQENIYSQIKTFCASMDEILLPDSKSINESSESTSQRNTAVTRSGLGLAVGRMSPQNKSSVDTAVPDTKPVELSQSLKNLIGYTLELKPSQIPHKDAGQGLFIDGQADVGTVIAFYPGIIYSPAYYCYIPGYPRVDTHNPYLITRYDGTVINAQPWGVGGEIREVWDLSSVVKSRPNVKDDANNKGSDQIWKMLNKPLQATRVVSSGDVLERRNPLAFAHFANHPAKEMVPNVMVCPYDFPLTEKDMRTYIPNIKFGSGEEAKMKRFGSFWFIASEGATYMPTERANFRLDEDTSIVTVPTHFLQVHKPNLSVNLCMVRYGELEFQHILEMTFFLETPYKSYYHDSQSMPNFEEAHNSFHHNFEEAHNSLHDNFEEAHNSLHKAFDDHTLHNVEPPLPFFANFGTHFQALDHGKTDDDTTVQTYRSHKLEDTEKKTLKIHHQWLFLFLSHRLCIFEGSSVRDHLHHHHPMISYLTGEPTMLKSTEDADQGFSHLRRVYLEIGDGISTEVKHAQLDISYLLYRNKVRESTQQQQHVDQNNASMELINSVTGTDEEGRSRQRILTFAARSDRPTEEAAREEKQAMEKIAATLASLTAKKTAMVDQHTSTTPKLKIIVAPRLACIKEMRTPAVGDLMENFTRPNLGCTESKIQQHQQGPCLGASPNNRTPFADVNFS
ncbi:unnamed protein product [Camellia sinensis]